MISHVGTLPISALDEIKFRTLFVGFLSYEERCAALVRSLAVGCVSSRGAHVFFEMDHRQNALAEECIALQERWGAEITELAGASLVGRMNAGGSLESMIDWLDGLLKDRDPSSVCVDISAMPLPMWYGLLAFLLDEHHCRSLLITYTEPERYYRYTRWDYDDVTVVRPFCTEYTAGKQLLWLPLLGLEGGLAAKILESTPQFSAIRPIVSFPNVYGDRVLYANRDIIESLPDGLAGVTFAGLADPLDVFRTIKELVDAGGPNDRFVLSPLGMKLQSLGAFMAARRLRLPVVYAEARTFDPTASEGLGRSHVVVLDPACGPSPEEEKQQPA